MASCTETEIKLVATPAMLERLAGDPLLAGPEVSEQLESTYFDTADGVLAREHVALRLRRTGRALEQTLKLPPVAGEGLQRGEWTVDAAGLDAPDPARFPAEPAARLAALLGGKALVAVLATRVARRSRRLRHGASLIEADFDSGAIEGGGRSEAICELELELVEGGVADLFRLARELPLGPDLAWSLASKSERGRALVAGAGPVAVQARPLALGADATTGEALAAIARECLEQVLGNYRLVVVHGLPEAVHQTRVAIRRLRAAFSLFRSAFAPDGLARFASRWKAAAAALGPARDAHVLLAGIAAGAGAGEGEAHRGLCDHLARRRDAATREAQAVLAGQDFQRLLVDFALWIEEGCADPDGADRPFRKCVAKVLRRRRHRLAKAAGRLCDLDEAALHDLRIDVKKLRYGAEFAQSVLPDGGRDAHDRARDLRALQDALGEVNDLAAAARSRPALFGGLPHGEAERFCAELAAIEVARHASRGALLRRAERRLSRLAEAPAWWKPR